MKAKITCDYIPRVLLVPNNGDNNYFAGFFAEDYVLKKECEKAVENKT